MGIRMRTKVVIPVIAAILILGSSGMDQKSYGGNFFLTDLNPPDYRNSDCSLTIGFLGFPLTPTEILNGGTCTAGPLNPDFPVEVIYDPPLVLPGEASPQTVIGQTIHIHNSNFIDPLNTKLIRVQILFDSAVAPPQIFNIKPQGAVDDCILDQSGTSGTGHLFEDWICHPNPDNERIWIELPSNMPDSVFEVIVDTVSLQEVGGKFIGVDSTALILAGSQMTLVWLIPVVVSAIGIGIVIARKF